MGFRSTRRAVLLAAAALLFALLLVPTAANAAVQIAVPQGCVYGSSADTPQTIPYNLAGMAPGAHYSVTLDGQAVATGTADAAGAASGEFPAPTLRHAEKQATVAVNDGTATAQQTIDLTDFDAAITPSTGATRRRVKIALFGWVGKTVFLHYLPPHSKKATRTVRIAKTTGTCGHATARLSHLFPRGARKGKWRLIFDTSRTYRSSTKLKIEYDTTIR
jgi:hypothetical protein